MKTVHEIVSDLIQRVIIADESDLVDEKNHLFLEFVTYYESSKEKRKIKEEVEKIMYRCDDQELMDFFEGAMI